MNNEQSQVIGILGTGAWGSTLAKLVSHNNHQVRIWSRRCSEPLAVMMTGVDLIVSAVSMKGVKPTIKHLQSVDIPTDTIIVSATKGLDLETTRTPSQLWQESFLEHPVVVLSGPNLAKEIQKGLPATTVVASEVLSAAETVQKVFSSESFRVYVNHDPLGTELGGTLKNIVAIAAGVCDGLQLGNNAKASLLTRALAEMIRVGEHLGASPQTFFGLSGLGDLLATCSGSLSRNYQVGYGLSQGKTLEEILSTLEGTAEGVNTTQVLVKLASQEKIATPIARQVNQLLQGETTPKEAVHALMERDLTSEF